MDSFYSILVVILIASNGSVYAGATTWGAYLRRGIVTVLASWVLVWMYIGLSMLFAGIEPEFLRHAVTLLPICGVGLTLTPLIAERWATGPSYRSPFADVRPTRIAVMIVAMSVLYSALIMGPSYLTTL
jgi:xanthine/uracil permease